MKKPASAWRSIRLSLAVLAGLFIFAYGFQVTKINLLEFRDENRLVSRERVTRLIARPNIIEYDQEEYFVTAPIYVPCNPTGVPLPEIDKSKAYLVLTPTCADPGGKITVEGFDFPTGIEAPISFSASNDPEPEKYIGLVTKRVRPDQNGYFKIEFETAERPADYYQYIRVTVRENVGSPKFTQVSLITFDKIIETIFMALIATVIGTILAMPVSFIAARNVMRNVRNPLTSVALGIIGLLLGFGLGIIAASYIGKASVQYLTGTSGINAMKVLQILITPGILWGAMRLASQLNGDSNRSIWKRGLGSLLQGIAIVSSILMLFLLADFSISLGDLTVDSAAYIAIIGNLIYQLGDILTVLTPIISAIIVGGIIGSLFSRVGQTISETMGEAAVRAINIIAAGTAGALLMILLGFIVDWLYTINDPLKILWIPGIVGAAFGILVGLLSKAKQPLPVGMVIYFLTRTVLNTMRSIEPIVWAIVAVIWVGIGPFAGVMALAIHTLAALGKLYSEQVENIQPGPIEAVTATGATRLQTIIYAIVPQIIPPYISFTMYRWDINVRMSTIIGFVGGGGIGAVLFQNLQMLNYRDASVQMLAITIVVGTMDYISSVLRERYV